MAKHDRAKQEKNIRNLTYANQYRQRKCKDCGHKSSRPGKCVLCSGEMKRAKRKENS